MDDFTDADWADYFGYTSDDGWSDFFSSATSGYNNNYLDQNWGSDSGPSSSLPQSQSVWDSFLNSSGNTGAGSTVADGTTWNKFLNSLVPSGGFNTGGLLSAGLGALGGGLSSSTAPTETTSKSAPWEAQQPFLLDLFSKASGQLNTIDPLSAKAKLNYGSLLGGPAVNPYLGLDNPYLNKAIDNAQSDFMRGFQPMVNQANVASGSFGNSGVAQTYGKEAADQLGRIDTNMRMQDYGAQQQLAESAVGRTANATQGAADFNFSPLKNYGSLITGQNFGGTTTTPLYNNTMGNILGGALAGTSIYKNLSGG